MLVHLFVLSLVFSCCSLAAVEAKTKEANKINEHLVQKCSTDDFDANLAAAKGFLVERQQKTSTYFNSNKALIKSLDTFISLEQIVNGSQQCNVESYKILMANDALVGGDLHKKVEQSTVESLTRLESLIYSVMLKHADTCPEIYRNKYDRAEKLSSGYSEIIKQAQDATREANSLLNVSEKHIERVYAQLLHRDLVRLVKQANDPDADFVFMEPGEVLPNNFKLEELMEKYIRQPCMKYVDTFGNELFRPAEFDARLEPSLIRVNLKDAPTYYTCLNIIDSHFYKSILNSMLKVASQPEIDYKFMITGKPS